MEGYSYNRTGENKFIEGCGICAGTAGMATSFAELCLTIDAMWELDAEMIPNGLWIGVGWMLFRMFASAMLIGLAGEMAAWFHRERLIAKEIPVVGSDVR